MSRLALTAAVGAALLSTGPAQAAAPAPRDAWVAVSVATIWRAPTSARVIDRPALAVPSRVREWLGRLSTTQRRDLTGRADTQVLMGDRVQIVGRRGSWAQVVIPSQPTPLDRRGYPGWVPLAQLTGRAPTDLPQVIVVKPTTWLRTDDARQSAVTEISYATSLPVVGRAGGWVRVQEPTARVLLVSAAAVTSDKPGTGSLSAGGEQLVSAAQSFTGLPYLWAGRSGFGFDCSGLTSLVYQAHGLTLPRDADAQALAGSRTSALAPGDLMFYATRGRVHHVSMYAGGGLMVHAPRTGVPVQTIDARTPSYAKELVSTRQYVPSG